MLREKPVFTTPNVFPPAEFEQAEVDDDPEFREVVEPQHCYVCKQHYREIHPFYDQLCPACGDFNFAKRTETADLTGRVALLTGGRVKIGYQAGIKLLRAGAQLIVTTRFPRDAAARYAQEPDFEEWGDRLEIFGLDLRHTPSVEAFCAHLSSTRDRARLHRQQRLPDGAPAARVLRAHAGGRDETAPSALPGRSARAARHRYRGRPVARRCFRCVGRTRRVAGRSRGLATAISSRRAASTRICSRSTCASATPGGCCSPRCRRSSCSRCSSSTRSRRSSSTRASSR